MKKRIPLTSFVPALLLLAGTLPFNPCSAFAQSVQAPGDSPTAHEARKRMDMHDMGGDETLHLLVGHSMVLHSTSNIKRIFVGNPTVLQSYTGGPSEIVLTAKATGVSSLVVWDTQGQSCLYTIAADMDPETLQRSMHDAYPKSQIDVGGHEGRIFLSGTVPTQEASDNAFKLASSYSKDVVNSIRVVTIHGKQVQLKLRIVEVDRTKMEQFGINLFRPTASNAVGGLTTGQFPSLATYATGTPATATAPAVPATINVNNPLNFFIYSFSHEIGATIQDLEQKQILQVLAEPTLTAMSGQSAKFLSGGEFPFPVVQGGGSAAGVAITISFRPYGVKVDFTPTVNEDGSIHLKVAPEVSTLDFSNAVTISGFTIPALSTRRAETEVEILNGQTFALTGLLDHRTTESLSQIPGISRLPILGKLFATTKSYTHSVIELVVLVTANVVDPLTQPTDTTQPDMAVPNLDKSVFDNDLSKEQKLPKKP
ncbi:type II and III secretion system protein family protein [Granulicella tundricola]|uniref:type II and III secretion system protein family protein n=1 Tax=Granulicella tundricola TaxID=940615 RepID=UPI0018DBD1D3|nr:type II and III secretion system protein family protein [Granulicella tundricola]